MKVVVSIVKLSLIVRSIMNEEPSEIPATGKPTKEIGNYVLGLAVYNTVRL
jgi:hypothetical protein